MAFRSIFNNKVGYRTTTMYLFVGAIIGLSSILFSMYIVRQLAIKETNEIKLWSHAMTMASASATTPSIDHVPNENLNRLLLDIVENNTIPSIITDRDLRVIKYTNVKESIIKDPKRLMNFLEELTNANTPIEIKVFGQGRFYIFYGKSQLLALLRFYPFLQMGLVCCFVLIIFISFRASKQDEQKRVWIGMAKETAHQLGTPTSSLLGWMEYLKEQNLEPFVVDEMSKDVARLLKVVDRFSKIGSETNLEPKNVTTIVNSVVTYFQTRMPKQAELVYDHIDSQPVQAMVNEALFEWVLENLLKNALDALQGRGLIKVTLHQEKEWITIDVKDSGKGIPKANFNTIFNPGYTTKTRGWGLGLSLSRRIVQEYHHGKIFVAESEQDKGTTMRVMIRKL